MVLRTGKAGFMLLEVVLAVALIAILFGTSYVLYQNIPYRNDLDDALRVSESLLRDAELHAMAVSGDSSWGVRFEPGFAILFKGQSYDTRDESYDEAVQIFVEVSGDTEYVFEKVSGRPEAPGEVTFSSEATGESSVVYINAYGSITTD